MSKRSVFGLSENIAGLFSYAGVFVTGAIVLVLERENKFVRFHALQSVLWFLFLSVLKFVLGFISFLPFMGILAVLVQIVGVASWIYLMYMAFNNHKFKLPTIGDVVEAQINK